MRPLHSQPPDFSRGSLVPFGDFDNSSLRLKAKGSAIIVLSPLFLVVVVVLLLTGEHQVFYLQERVGRGGISFKVIKFVTMMRNSSKMQGGFLTQKGDPRVLSVGRYLRKGKVNELPQLFNIWKGDMSFVGPRPQARVHYDLYSPEQKEKIKQLTPGLSGVGSLVFRDEESLLERSGQAFDSFHDKVIAPYKGDLESWFYANQSLWLYIKVIIITAVSLVAPKLNVIKAFKGCPKPPKVIAALL